MIDLSHTADAPTGALVRRLLFEGGAPAAAAPAAGWRDDLRFFGIAYLLGLVFFLLLLA